MLIFSSKLYMLVCRSDTIFITQTLKVGRTYNSAKTTESYKRKNFKNRSSKSISAKNIPPSSCVDAKPFKSEQKIKRISFIMSVFLQTVRQRAAYDRPHDVHFHIATIFPRQVCTLLCSPALEPHFFLSLSRSPLE